MKIALPKNDVSFIFLSCMHLPSFHVRNVMDGFIYVIRLNRMVREKKTILFFMQKEIHVLIH
jgi:hypothetical protein